MIDDPPLNPHGLPSATAIEIVLTLWEIGLASETAVTDWADAQILTLEHPSADLIELSANGVKLCLNRNSIDSRSIKLTFIEQFSLKAHLLDLACDRSAEDFIAWVSRNCWGENLEHPALRNGYVVSLALSSFLSFITCVLLASFLAYLPDLYASLRLDYLGFDFDG
jgi:hypothetical protein